MKKKKFHSISLLVVLCLLISMMYAPAVSAEDNVPEWVSKVNMPTARNSLMTGTVNGKIYAIGGSSYYFDEEYGCTRPQYLSTVEEYNPLSDTWTIKSDMDIGMESAGAAVVNNKIYIVSGYNRFINPGTFDLFLNSVKEYNPATDTWTEKANIITPRWDLTTSAVNGKIFAIGGCNCFEIYNTVEEYDPATDTWTAKSGMPNGVSGCTSAVVDGKIYVIGGEGYNGFSSGANVQEYNPATDTWSLKAVCPEPRTCGKAVTINGKIYFIGGYSEMGMSNSIDIYDPSSDTWSEYLSMPAEKAGFGVEYVNGSIYVIGGRCGIDSYDTVDQLQLEVPEEVEDNDPETVNLARMYLADVMDQFHNTYDVYTDAFAAGNNFSAKGMIGYAPTIIENYTQDVHSGITCIKASYNCGIYPNWGGWYFMNGILQGSDRTPSLNWGDYPDAGIDLSGATKLTFWAKGAVGGEKVEFFCSGIGRNSGNGTPTNPYPDSSPKISTGYVTLNNYWTEYTINLTGYDMSYVLGGFGWVTNDVQNNGQNINFYLDDIQFDKPRLDEPRMLVSYKTQNTSYDFDSVCRNVAYTYDNAMAIIAFLASGDSPRAKLIADAIIYAQNHDRYYTDGRLRNGYQAGELILPPGWTPNGISGTVRMPGWWDTTYTNWYEDQYVVSSNTGNMAWAMLGLLAYYQIEGGSQYLESAITMGEWIENYMRDIRGNGGYMGGYEGWEPSPTLLSFKSTEHNLDLYAAFTRLYQITGEAKWQTRAQFARNFVLTMWDSTEGKFWTGTDPDGVTTNQTPIPLDVQEWTLLSLLDLPDSYQAGLTYAENNHKIPGIWGFDFNTDRDGIWYEGTSQMATVYMLTGQEEKAGNVISTINVGRAPSGALYASNIDGLTTGFNVTTNIPWIYYMREHVGATAWGITAEKRVNPFWYGTADGTISSAE